MSRFPRLAISDWSGHFGAVHLDLDYILSQFPLRPFDACVVVDGTTDDEFSNDYWGTDKGWEQLEREAMSTEEFNRISAYLDETGHTSA